MLNSVVKRCRRSIPRFLFGMEDVLMNFRGEVCDCECIMSGCAKQNK